MSTDTMSTDNQVLTEILETLKGLSPPSTHRETPHIHEGLYIYYQF